MVIPDINGYWDVPKSFRGAFLRVHIALFFPVLHQEKKTKRGKTEKGRRVKMLSPPSTQNEARSMRRERAERAMWPGSYMEIGALKMRLTSDPKGGKGPERGRPESQIFIVRLVLSLSLPRFPGEIRV